jgi:hypothetical protein
LDVRVADGQRKSGETQCPPVFVTFDRTRPSLLADDVTTVSLAGGQALFQDDINK